MHAKSSKARHYQIYDGDELPRQYVVIMMKLHHCQMYGYVDRYADLTIKTEFYYLKKIVVGQFIQTLPLIKLLNHFFYNQLYGKWLMLHFIK